MRIILIVLSSFIFFACGSKKISISNNNKELSYQSPSKQFKTQYLLDLESNNNFVSVDLDKKPQPVQGHDQMIRDMYRLMKYPAVARKNSDQGTVLLESLVDKNGQIQNISINRSVVEELDKEAIRAFKEATKGGFEPFIYKGSPLQFKFILPVKFSFP